MVEISIGERISEIETFLGQEEIKLTTTEISPPVVTEPVPEPVISETPAYPAFSPTAANAEMIHLLSQMVKNQEIERKSWERNNPLTTDSPVYDWAEETIDPGYMVTFTLNVPEGQVFFFEYFNITYNADTTYNVYIDNVGPATLPTLTDVLQDFGNHAPFFKPPRLCYQDVVITALNNDDVAHTYSVFIRGFFRSEVKTDKEYLGSR